MYCTWIQPKSRILSIRMCYSVTSFTLEFSLLECVTVLHLSLTTTLLKLELSLCKNIIFIRANAERMQIFLCWHHVIRMCGSVQNIVDNCQFLFRMVINYLYTMCEYWESETVLLNKEAEKKLTLSPRNVQHVKSGCALLHLTFYCL